MELKIAICDDDYNYVEFIQKMIRRSVPHDDISIYKFYSSSDFINFDKKVLDLVFMDYRIDNLNGVDLSVDLRKENKEAVLVFLTGEIEPLPILFKLNTFRFIMKSESEEIIEEEVESILFHLREKKSDRNLVVKVGKGSKVLYLEDILYISKNKRGSSIKIMDKYTEEIDSIECRESVDEIYLMCRDKFEYPHSSYIVNFDNIAGFDNNRVIVKDGTELNISNSRRKYFIERLSSYMTKRYGRI